MKRKKPGRKELYKPDYSARAYRLSLLGLTDRQIADAFGVNHATFDLWKRTKSEFYTALQKGKNDADAKVATSLYQRAIGYQHPDVQITTFKDRKTGEVQVISTPITRYHPPDTTACIFWLKNRQRELWTDNKRLEHMGAVATLDLSDLGTEEIEWLAKIGLGKDVKGLIE